MSITKAFQQLRFKLGANLFLFGNRIISYSTHVASITPNGVEANGKYSRTTTKHITYVSGLLGLPMMDSKEKQYFGRYEYGVKCKPTDEVMLSEKTSLHIIKTFREESKGDCSHPSDYKNVVRSLRDIHRLTAMDWTTICLYLDLPEPGKVKQPYLKEIGWEKL